MVVDGRLSKVGVLSYKSGVDFIYQRVSVSKIKDERLVCSGWHTPYGTLPGATVPVY